MAPSVLIRVLDRGRAEARRLRGLATAAGSETAGPLPAIGGEETEPPLADGDAERSPPALDRADAREGGVDRSASREELAALRLSLVSELDRLALREDSTTAGPRR